MATITSVIFNNILCILYSYWMQNSWKTTGESCWVSSIPMLLLRPWMHHSSHSLQVFHSLFALCHRYFQLKNYKNGELLQPLGLRNVTKSDKEPFHHHVAAQSTDSNCLTCETSFYFKLHLPTKSLLWRKSKVRQSLNDIHSFSLCLLTSLYDVLILPCLIAKSIISSKWNVGSAGPEPFMLMEVRHW